MKKKQLLITGAAVALTAVLAVGGTLAYMTAITETKQNTFTSDKGVDIDIIEEKWEEIGKDMAKKYTPGDVIAKDPVITIEKGNVWVGMQLEYLDALKKNIAYGSVDETTNKKTGFSSYAQYDGINESWQLIAKNSEGSELYMNKTALATGGKTAPIFDNINVNAGIKQITETTNATYYTKTTKIENGVIVSEELTKVEGVPTTAVAAFDQDGNAVAFEKLPPFEIKATGYAVQSENVLEDVAKTELINLANAGVEEGSAKFFVAIK